MSTVNAYFVGGPHDLTKRNTRDIGPVIRLAAIPKRYNPEFFIGDKTTSIVAEVHTYRLAAVTEYGNIYVYTGDSDESN